MRRRIVFAGIAGVTLAGGFIACGLDENGQASDGGLDATSFDSPTDTPLDVPIDVPQACKTLDATACIGDASIPDGWTYAAFTLGQSICPTTVDYDRTGFLVAPQAGPCSCGCTPSGTIDCSGQVEAGSQGGSCNGTKTFLFDAGNDAACITTNWADNHILVSLLFDASTAKAGCDASATQPGWSSGDAAVCTPKCTADFCNVGSTFKRCVVSSTNQTCPAPFTMLQAPLGLEAGVQTSCTGCQCTAAASGACGAIVQPFNDSGCTDPVADASLVPLACTNEPSQVNSFSYVPIVPAVTCLPNAVSGTGSAQFASSITVCCLP